ncbi:PRKC apoptosis WT1 regulator protein [Crotalus adamanteus]|uniref:PRKC apoptosis WT1 regulator protein n=1 Tax=Crotalus adamanteus TaxID=8729 RepID=A0AAW1BCF5_CROAD
MVATVHLGPPRQFPLPPRLLSSGYPPPYGRQSESFGSAAKSSGTRFGGSAPQPGNSPGEAAASAVFLLGSIRGGLRGVLPTPLGASSWSASNFCQSARLVNLGSGAATTDFLEEWKAKREKMRAKQAPPAGVSDGKVATNIATSGGGGSTATAAELNNNGSGGMNCVPLARNTPKEPQPTAGTRAGGAEPPGSRTSAAPTSPEEEKVAPKGKGSSGPSARKGKGQIEKRKLREKRRSTGVVNIPATEVSRRWVKRAGAGEEGAAQLGGEPRLSLRLHLRSLGCLDGA